MGKRLEDLHLTDEPILSVAPVDVRTEEWYQFARDIDDLLATGHYTWAEDTLTDIQATLERTRTVTSGQRRAVQNIEDSRSRQRSGGRRYEGFR